MCVRVRSSAVWFSKMGHTLAAAVAVLPELGDKEAVVIADAPVSM